MKNTNIEVCPACGVKIEAGERVLFSAGPVGTRARLWARVCQYAKKPGCINLNTDAIGPIAASDYYGDIELPVEVAQPVEPLAAVVAGIQRSLDG
ncbi:hypothetical protein [Oculatella sp. LEGE 06141]|nr:hypothetical protein [Oculatella sp. LEGE 06141]